MPAVGFLGASYAQCRKVRRTFERPLAAPTWRRNSGSGPAEARAFDTWKSFVRSLDRVGPSRDREYRPQRAGAGASSNDGSGLTPRPARSDGLGNVSGGPDASFYIQLGVI